MKYELLAIMAAIVWERSAGSVVFAVNVAESILEEIEKRHPPKDEAESRRQQS